MATEARPIEARAEGTVEAGGTKQAAFAGRMLGVFNHGLLALMTSVGHRTALFDTMAGLAPSTAADIAAAAGLQGRYVRESLGAMVLGGVVEHDPSRGTYRLVRWARVG